MALTPTLKLSLMSMGGLTCYDDARARPHRRLQAGSRFPKHTIDEFRVFRHARRLKKCDLEWQRKQLENKDIVFRKNFQDIEYVLHDHRRTRPRSSEIR